MFRWCVGAAALVGQVVATRRSAGRSQAFQEVKHAVHQFMAGESTPEFDENMESVVQHLASTQMLVLDSKDATQTLVDEAVAELRSSTEVLVEAKGAADAADSRWIECGAGLWPLYDTRTKSWDAWQHQQNVTTALCERPGQLKSFSFLFPNREVSCTFSKDQSCSHSLGSASQGVLRSLDELRTQVAAVVEEYQSAVNACHQAEEQLEVTRQEYRRADGEWGREWNLCLDARVDQRAALCAVSSKLQDKCTALSVYSSLIAEVQGSGSSKSNPDRRQEMETLTAVECLAQNRDSTNPDNLRQICLNSAASAVAGVLVDERSAAVDELTTPASFTCQESTIAFSGETWYWGPKPFERASVPPMPIDALCMSGSYTPEGDEALTLAFDQVDLGAPVWDDKPYFFDETPGFFRQGTHMHTLTPFLLPPGTLSFTTPTEGHVYLWGESTSGEAEGPEIETRRDGGLSSLHLEVDQSEVKWRGECDQRPGVTCHGTLQAWRRWVDRGSTTVFDISEPWVGGVSFRSSR